MTPLSAASSPEDSPHALPGSSSESPPTGSAAGGAAKKHCTAPLSRKIVRDGAIVAAAAAVILAWAVFRRPSQGAMLYYQYRAMHDAPAAGPAYWTTPALRAFTVAAMTHFGDDDDDPATDNGSDDNCTPLPPHLVPPGGAGDPPALAKLNPYMQYILSDGMQVVFCHQVTSADGLSRLVIVTVGPQRQRAGIFPELNWETVVLEPAGWSNLPRAVGRQRAAIEDPLLLSRPATFFAGAQDGANPAAFSVPYSVAGQSRSLRFTLLAGGRRVAVSEVR